MGATTRSKVRILTNSGELTKAAKLAAKRVTYFGNPDDSCGRLTKDGPLAGIMALEGEFLPKGGCWCDPGQGYCPVLSCAPVRWRQVYEALECWIPGYCRATGRERRNLIKNAET